jgi:hypothetical protein
VRQFALLKLMNRVAERDGKRCVALPAICLKLDWQQSTCKGWEIQSSRGKRSAGTDSQAVSALGLAPTEKPGTWPGLRFSW